MYFNITDTGNTINNNMNDFPKCNNWFASSRFFNTLINAYFRQSKIYMNMTDVSTIVSKYLYDALNSPIYFQYDNNCKYNVKQCTLFLPTDLSSDDRQFILEGNKECKQFFSDKIVKIGIKSEKNLQRIHLGVIGIKRETKCNFMNVLNEMRTKKIFMRQTHCCHCSHSEWPSYYFFNGICQTVGKCPKMNAADELVKKIPNHNFSLFNIADSFDQPLRSEANTKITYLRILDSLESNQYVRRIEQYFFHSNKEIRMNSNSNVISSQKQECKEIEYTLALDVSSHTVLFSRNIDIDNYDDQHNQSKKKCNQSLKKTTHTLSLNLDAGYTYVPFIEGNQSLNVVFY